MNNAFGARRARLAVGMSHVLLLALLLQGALANNAEHHKAAENKEQHHKAVAPATSKCPKGYESAGAKCVSLSSSYASFAEAEKECAKLKGKLADLINHDEEEAVAHKFTGTRYWVRRAKHAGDCSVVLETGDFMKGEACDTQLQFLCQLAATASSAATADNYKALAVDSQPISLPASLLAMIMRSKLMVNGEHKKKAECFKKNLVYMESFTRGGSVEDCGQMCKDIAGCKFFVFDSKDGRCWIKTYSATNAVVFKKNIQSGTNTYTFTQKGLLLVGKAMEMKSVNECQKCCQRNPKCRTFTFFGPASPNPNVCVHNYDAPMLAERAATDDDVVSGPAFCSSEEESRTRINLAAASAED